MRPVAGSFEEDFARYRAQGHIGPAEPAQPRIEVPRLDKYVETYLDASQMSVKISTHRASLRALKS